MSLLIVGSLAFDTVKTREGVAENVFGGSAAYSAVAASYFTRPWLVAPVGDDFPEENLELLRAKNICTKGACRIPGSKTFRWAGSYSDDFLHRKTEKVELNVFEQFDNRIPAEYLGAEYVVLSSTSPASQLEALAQLTARKVTFLDTMPHWIDWQRAELVEALAKTDIALVNDAEARQFTGEPELLAAARKIASLGPRIVVVKKGAHGSLLLAGGEAHELPAFPSDVVRDPTGAGDCFGGALAGYVAKCGNTRIDTLKRGVIYGTIIASFCIEDFSLNRLRALTLADIERRREAFVKSLSGFLD